MAVELYVGGLRVELDHLTKIKYSKQVSDIFNVAKASSSYTNSFSVPKTPRNTMAFQGLGLVGSTSNIPYQKTLASLKDSGFDIIVSGWLDIKETSETYKVNIIDGIIDFYKEIENYTLADLDLSELNHEKSLFNVIFSMGNPNLKYKYVVNDYGGGQSVIPADINIDYLVPSAKYPFLFEKLFEFFGYTVNGSIFQNDDYLDAWLTYPKEAVTEEKELIGEFSEGEKEIAYISNSSGNIIFPQTWDTDDIVVDSGIELVGNTIVITEENYYEFEFSGQGRCSLFTGYVPFYARIKRNGVAVGVPLQIFNTGTYITTFQGYLNEGDVITFEYFLNFSGGMYNPTLFLDFFNLNVRKSVTFEVDWSLVLKDISVTSFYNDFLRRFGLTAIIDNQLKHIKFYTLAERLDISQAQDWSAKYVKRNSETYLYGSYAQNNFYRHKYNQENASYNDGSLVIDNQNLDTEKTLYGSFTYSADFGITPIGSLGVNTFRTPIWTSEAVDNDGAVEVNYKTLNGRFYIIKHYNILTPIRFYSLITGQDQIGSAPAFAKFDNVHLVDLIAKYYPAYTSILNSCKVHDLEMALGLGDIINIDFTKPIYIEQEASYYLFNKVDWESGKTCKVEAVKINT